MKREPSARSQTNLRRPSARAEPPIGSHSIIIIKSHLVIGQRGSRPTWCDSLRFRTLPLHSRYRCKTPLKTQNPPSRLVSFSLISSNSTAQNMINSRVSYSAQKTSLAQRTKFITSERNLTRDEQTREQANKQTTDEEQKNKEQFPREPRLPDSPMAATCSNCTCESGPPFMKSGISLVVRHPSAILAPRPPGELSRTRMQVGQLGSRLNGFVSSIINNELDAFFRALPLQLIRSLAFED